VNGSLVLTQRDILFFPTNTISSPTTVVVYANVFNESTQAPNDCFSCSASSSFVVTQCLLFIVREVFFYKTDGANPHFFLVESMGTFGKEAIKLCKFLAEFGDDKDDQLGILNVRWKPEEDCSRHRCNSDV
jgi:hypothetical protein